MKRALRCAGKITRLTVVLLLGALLAGNLYFLFMERVAGTEHPTLLGYSVAVVASGSMEPSLSVGDMIVNRVESDYEEGDIITFRSGDSLTTHRIVAVTSAGYATKGDANNAVDPDIVSPESVVGRVAGRIPHVGNAIFFLRTPLGMVLLIFAGLLMIELPFVFQRHRDLTDGEERC